MAGEVPQQVITAEDLCAVQHLARYLWCRDGRFADLSDYESAGLAGLAYALRSYNIAGGTAWTTWRDTCIRSAIGDERRNIAKLYGHYRSEHQKKRRKRHAHSRDVRDALYRQAGDELDWIEAQQYVRGLFRQEKPTVQRRLQALMAGKTQAEVAQQDKVRPSAICLMLRDIRQRYTREKRRNL